MSTNTIADQTATDTMPHYAPNNLYAVPAPGTRSRGSSAASRYVPDNYPIPPPTNSHAFVPARPEQYRPPPDTRGIPPAQLRPYHPDAYMRSKSEGYESRRSGDVRRSFGDDPRRSYHSSRSHRSSHDSHRGSGERRRDAERRRDQEEAWEDAERRRELRRGKSHHHHRHHDEDDNYRLKRRATPRGYGSSLFAVFDHIKNALK